MVTCRFMRQVTIKRALFMLDHSTNASNFTSFVFRDSHDNIQILL